jgi:diadenosine tetraphosphate (Ap4A) HIT family hydrolase
MALWCRFSNQIFLFFGNPAVVLVAGSQQGGELTDHEAAELGPMLRRVSRAVRALTGCERVYAIAFGQGAPHLHVHLIPRFDAEPATAAWNIADWYRAVERGERPAADPAAVADFVRRLRGVLESTAG